MQLAISLRSQTSNWGALCRPIMLVAGPAQNNTAPPSVRKACSVAPWWAQMRLGLGPSLGGGLRPPGT